MLLAVGAVVSGCSGSGIGSSLSSIGGALPSWFTRSPSPGSPAAASAGVRTLDEDCPSVDIRTGAGTLAVTAKSPQPAAMDLRYQLTFNELARQCTVEGSTVRMRVGVQGRAVIGPAGAPSQISVPLRYAVVREGVAPRTIVTKFRRISLQMPPGVTNLLFTDIEEDLSFPMPPQSELLAYIVYVGFDDMGDREQRRPPARKKKASVSVR
jgi:hypothetical protein